MTVTPFLHLSGSEHLQAPADDELRRLDAYWRAANYLAVGMIYLQDSIPAW